MSPAAPVCAAGHDAPAGSLRAALKALALFEQRHPGLKVKAEYMGFAGYLERLTTQIAGGSEPDVMQINWAWLATCRYRSRNRSIACA